MPVSRTRKKTKSQKRRANERRRARFARVFLPAMPSPLELAEMTKRMKG